MMRNAQSDTVFVPPARASGESQPLHHRDFTGLWMFISLALPILSGVPWMALAVGWMVALGLGSAESTAMENAYSLALLVVAPGLLLAAVVAAVMRKFVLSLLATVSAWAVAMAPLLFID